MDEIIGLLIFLYILGSVVSAVLEKAKRPSPQGEFGDADSVRPRRRGEPPVPPPWPEPQPIPQPWAQPVPPQRTAAPAEAPPPRPARASALPEAAGEGVGTEGPLPWERVASQKPAASAAKPVRRRGAATASELLAALEDVESLRRAVILAEVLGPPRSVQPHPFYPWRGTGRR